jgi:D-xylose reductase
MSVALRSGLQMPAMGFGTWKIPQRDAKVTVYEAIKAGFRHLDCACDYGNEKEVGEGISQAISEGIVKREELWISRCT